MDSAYIIIYANIGLKGMDTLFDCIESGESPFQQNSGNLKLINYTEDLL